VAKEKDPSRATPPPPFAEVPTPQTYPSGDYSYILEIVMGMQGAIGKLTEAVEGLKHQSSKHGDNNREAKTSNQLMFHDFPCRSEDMCWNLSRE